MVRRAKKGIPAYTANGLRLGNYSLGSLERYLALTPARVVVKRNKRTGRITSAQFLPLPENSSAVDGKGSVRTSASMGQRYSYAEHVDESGHSVWSFVKFLTPREMLLDPDVSVADCERWLQLCFRAVPLSCLRDVTEICVVKEQSNGLADSLSPAIGSSADSGHQIA
jgi:hypothetical protein